MRSWMYLLLCIFTAIVSTASAQNQQYALIIGIDEYKPANAVIPASTSVRMWRNLDGCVNDAMAIRDLSVSKYAFAEKNITTLFNEEASRASILEQLKKLVSQAKKGDVVFIYYAGHGSQVQNSLSKEADKKDETMVPADAWKEGVEDIRDKELAVYFNQLVDKGVLLTVIFDSCHSGSIGRGDNFLNDPPKTRYLADANYDAKDATEPERPELKGALIISAAQDFEFAKEQKDEHNIAHGAFTIAFLKAVQQLSPDASVSDIYNSLSGIMKYYGKTQEPVLAANEARKAGTLFALPKGAIKNKFTVAAGRIESRGVELNGGYAFGLSKGIMLASVNGKDTLEIVEMRGANKSLARSVSGNHRSLTPGSLFEVINWASGAAPALKVYIPSAVETAELERLISTYQSVRGTKKINWVTDISKANPDKIYFYESGKLKYNDKKEGKKSLEGNLAPQSMISSLGNAGSAFVNMPASTVFANAIRESFKNNNNIEIVSDAAASQYTLVGALTADNALQYALVKSQVTVQDSTESLPLRTNFETIDGSVASINEAAKNLANNAFKIAKIRDWLMLESPRGQSKFPFKLDFEYYSTGAKVKADRVKISDTLSIYFQEDTSEAGWRSNYKKRYIYIFSIDSKGSMNLLFPDINSGNIENKFPVTDRLNNAEMRTHIADILITPPAGADNYFMLSSEQAIGNLGVFNQEGVITRGPVTDNPLEDLLFTGSKTRSEIITPVTWSVSKTILRTANN